jgi:hypothetical protein
VGKFLPPKGQQVPALLADLKSRMRRAEHKIEAIQSTATDTGGITVTYSATAPASPKDGDVWYQTSGNQITGAFQWNGTEWVAYVTDGSTIAAGTVSADQLESGITVPGIINGTVIEGAQLIGTGSNGEILAYNGTPAAGNMLISVSGASFTDAEGNDVRAGFTAYGSDGGFASIEINPDGAGFTDTRFLMQPAYAATVTNLTQPPQVVSQVQNQGEANAYAWLGIASGMTSNGAAGYISVTTTAQDGSTTGAVNLGTIDDEDTFTSAFTVDVDGAVAIKPISAAHPGTFAEESWQQPVLSNGWTQQGTGSTLRYALMPDGNVHMSGRLACGTTFSGSQAVCTLASGYAPARNEPVWCYGRSATSPYAQVTGVFGVVTTAGVLTLYGAMNSGQYLEIQGSYPLET